MLSPICIAEFIPGACAGLGVSGDILGVPMTHPDLSALTVRRGISHPVVRVGVDAEVVMLVGYSPGTFGQHMTVVIIVRFTTRKGGCLEKRFC